MNFERSQHHNKHIDSQFYKQIPSDWSSIRLKFVSNKVKTGSTPSTSVSEYFEDEVDWFTPEDFNSKIYLNSSKRKISTLAIDDGAAPLFPARTIFLVGIGSTGNVGIFHKAASSNQQINAIIVNKKILPEFLVYYLFSAKSIVKSLANLTLLSILNQEKTKQIPILLPPILEQKSIVEFLDYKTNQIDNLIDKKEKLLKLLEEKRIALITNAVTKGIDPNANMKPTGINWLGEIPEHWDIKRLRYLAEINPLKSEIDLDQIDEVSFVPMEAVNEYGGINLQQNKLIEDVYSGYTYFRDNDILVAKITPCFENGKGSIATSLTNGIGFGTTELHIIRCKSDLLPRYCEFITYSGLFRKLGTASMYGAGGQKRVPESFIKDFLIALPPLEEQERILEFFDTELNKLSSLKEKIIGAIDKLKEYRTSLITSAVTGKIDVRNWTPKEESKDDSLLEEVKEELK